ncbi:AMP-binding protein [Nesterenkonia sp. CF4.4]|uniref:AMP-binding protein n=1 Tax=Nesterenkonia sp. CF4.4 TaxID=3373079 RepID=UPI003EE70CB7
MPETTSPTDDWVPAALSALRAVLGPDPAADLHISSERASDTAPPLEFHPADATGIPTWTSRHEVPAEMAAVIVRTSGSTGTPKQTLLPAAAINASVSATAQALGGHGQWLLTLQPSYVAGLAVLARSLGAGTTPVALLQHTTDPQAFTEAAQRLTADRRFVSLVPTQLQRLLDHVPQDAALAAALARFDAILLGGGASSAELLDLSAAHGLHVVRTYGMSETGGGCVYDGRPLPGVRLETLSAADGTSRRVRITGPMVAHGYLEDPNLTEAHFSLDPDSAERRFLTDDLGEVQTDAEGQLLRIAGRADDVINTGGVKISAEGVRAVLLSHPRVREAFVAPVPDLEWGQKVCAAVVLTEPADPGQLRPASDAAPDVPSAAAEEPRAGGIERELQQLVRGSLGRAAAPKRLLVLRALPTLTSGKPDRQELLRLLDAPVP